VKKQAPLTEQQKRDRATLVIIVLLSGFFFMWGLIVGIAAAGRFQ